MRQLLAGAAMDGSGLSAMDWLESPDNDLGLAAFLDAYERSVIAETPEARETSLVEALLAAGAMLSVLEQAGDPVAPRRPALGRGDEVGVHRGSGGRGHGADCRQRPAAAAWGKPQPRRARIGKPACTASKAPTAAGGNNATHTPEETCMQRRRLIHS